MSELIDSGLVGHGDKTDEEIFKVWNSIGFIDHINGKEDKMMLAIIMEKAAKILIDNPDRFEEPHLDIMVFPTILRVAGGFNEYEQTNKIVNDRLMKPWKDHGGKSKLTKAIDVEDIMEILDKSFTSMVNVYKLAYNNPISKECDYQAETVANISEIIIQRDIKRAKFDKEI